MRARLKQVSAFTRRRPRQVARTSRRYFGGERLHARSLRRRSIRPVSRITARSGPCEVLHVVRRTGRRGSALPQPTTQLPDDGQRRGNSRRAKDPVYRLVGFFDKLSGDFVELLNIGWAAAREYRPQIAVAIDQKALRNARKFADIQKRALKFWIRPDQRVIKLHLVGELVDLIGGFIVGVEADNFEALPAILVLQFDQGRHFASTWAAPRGPEIYK